MKLELPYPPGVNTLYGVRAVISNGRPMAFPYKTHEHRDYSTAVKLAALEAGLRADTMPVFPKPATVALLVRLYRPRRAGDIDGPLKTLLDVLQGIVFENDDQVARLEVYRHDDKHRPRVELEVTELATNETAKQEELFGEEARHAAQPDKTGTGAAVVTPPRAVAAGPESSLDLTLRVAREARRRQQAQRPQQDLRRLAKSAVISNQGGDEPPF